MNSCLYFANFGLLEQKNWGGTTELLEGISNFNLEVVSIVALVLLA